MGAQGRPGIDRQAFMQALRAATQWRLLLLWVVAWWVPTAIVSLPLWRRLDALLGHSVHAQALASGLDALALEDTLRALAPSSGMLAASAVFGLLLTALLSPLLNGMAVGSALMAGRSPGFGQLLRHGVSEYPRLFRLLLWSILVYGLVALVGAGALELSHRVAQSAALQSTADHAFAAAGTVLLVLFVLAQVAMEGARAGFMADGDLRSARRALGRGLLLLRRPLTTLAYFLAVSVVGYALALLLAALRGHLPRGNLFEWLAAIVLAQLIVLLIGWVHIARMFALAVVAREQLAAESARAASVAVASPAPAQ